MTTTSAASAGLTVSTRTSVEEAQLAVQILNGPLAMAGMRAMSVLLRREQPLTFEEYERDYAPGSDGCEDLHAAMNSAELVGTLVKRGALSAALVDDLLWIEGTWRAVEGVVRGLREKTGEPRLYENFELLLDAGQDPRT